MTEAKTRPTNASVAAFLDSAEPPVRRIDGHALCALFARVSQHPAVMWGPSIIGFGRLHYRHDSGHEGDMPRIAFSPRKASLVLYLSLYDGFEDDLARLGRHKRGKSCLYLGRLADVDLAVLETMVRRSWEQEAPGCG